MKMESKDHIDIVAGNIIDYLAINKMTVYRLSARCGIANNRIHDFLKGKSKDVYLSTITTYANTLNISVVELLTPGIFKKE